MSITNTVSINQYIGNGSASDYAYTFKIFLESDLLVIQTDSTTGVDTTLVLNTDYTVSGVQVTTGGNVTLTAGNLPSGDGLTIKRVEPLTQLTEFRNQSEYFAELHENAMDKLTMIAQQQQDDLDRCLRVPDSVDLIAVSTTLPSPAATTLFGWNAAADEIIQYTPDDIVNAGSIGIFTANRALISNAGGVITAATTTSSEIGYLNGVPYALTTYVPQGDTHPSCQNIGIAYSAGTFTVQGANGSALSSSNPGYITIGSQVSPGRLVRLTITANQTFIDDAGASQIVGEEFGTKAGTAWSNDRPFFLYAVNKDDTAANLLFGISPCPSFERSPSSATLIGYKSSPSSTPSDASLWLFGSSLTTSQWLSLPVLRIGGIRMRKSSSDDWTVQALDASDGIRPVNYEKSNFRWSAGEAPGTAAGTFFTSVSAPTWASPGNIVANYQLLIDGTILAIFNTGAANSCTNGGNASQTRVALPFFTNSTFYGTITSNPGLVGNVRTAAVVGTLIGDVAPGAAGNELLVYKNDFATAVANNSFSNTADDIYLCYRYLAF